jgi:lysophospholipase L1-like esterase
MLGVNDRAPLRERAPPAKEAASSSDNAHPGPAAAGAPRQPPSASYEFHTDKWAELYSKRIDDMIAALKTRGVPIIWVGLPAIRGAKSTTDMSYLDELYRARADKTGIAYVDIWDGFVDEAGRFLQKGPDFEGQIRQLRTYDGVYFTKAGARKLAHYVEREITRLLAARSAPITLPTEPATPDANAVPGQPARPLAGPILPLVASSVGTDQLLGGPGSRPAAVDALAARTLVKGEALAPPAGRADDFAWPRREAGIEQAKGDAPLPASPPADNATAPAAAVTPPAPAQTPLKPRRPLALPLPQQPARNQSPFQDFFGFGGAPPRQMAPPRPPAATGVPRPPAAVGRSAAFQNDWFR